MRKLLFSLLAAVSALCLTSCEDEEIARTLDGIWEGEVSVGRWNSYQYVDIQFSRDQYSAGYGMEYDYQGNSGVYVECPFTFKVLNGTIFMEYDDGSRVAIRNYSLTDTHFSGDFYEWVGNYSIGSYIAHFDFYKVISWRHSRFGGYYTAQPDSTVTIEKVEQKIVSE